MGWMFSNSGTGNLTAKEYVLHRVLENWTCELVDISVQGNTAYLALKTKAGDVMGLVLLLSKYQGEWGYKDVDECMGPCETKCPKRILDKLSPTDSQYANDWRQACYDRIKAPKQVGLKHGDWIELNRPMSFRDGSSQQTLQVQYVESWPRNKRLFIGSNGRRYRIIGLNKVGFKVVDPTLS